jgi:hypothetical protein
MGLIPATGSEIAMGRVANAYGLGAVGTVTVGLNGVGSAITAKLGAQISKSAAQLTSLSIDFGGKTTPNTY